MQTNRKNLLLWSGWFFFGNAILFWLIGLNYFQNIAWLDVNYISHRAKLLIKLFAVLTYTGHLGLLAMLPLALFIPIILLMPKRYLIFPLAICLAVFLGFILIIDEMTYKLYRFHLNGVILNIAVNGLGEKVWELSDIEYLILGAIIAGLLTIESIFAFWLWRRINKAIFKQGFIWVIAILSMFLYASYSMIIYSHDLLANRMFIEVSRFMPLYSEIFGALLPMKEGRKKLEALTQSFLIQPGNANIPLNYPLKPLQCKPAKEPLNFVMIVIDTWRSDQVNSEITPTINDFSKKSSYFTKHFSGGNSTGPGIFSLFYALPVSYWTSMEKQKQGPLLLDEMMKQGYQMGIFGSATLKLPPFNKTVFNSIKNLKLDTPGETPYDRDRAITKEFKEFIADAVKNSKPFYSFLFYDGAHSYCAYNEDLSPLKPAVKDCNRMKLTKMSNPTPYFNRYKNALMLMDQEVKQVLQTLKEHNLLKNTVVMLTGDHGEEFNDNHQGFWGHASNFTHYQTQTPLIIYWPDEKPQTYTHLTSHFDIAPTLLSELLGCKESSTNLSLGKNLFDKGKRPYLIIGSYTGFAVLESDRITEVSPTGNFQVEQLNATPHPDGKLNIAIMENVFDDIQRFYKKTNV